MSGSLLKLFCPGSKKNMWERLINAEQMIIVYNLNLELSDSVVIHGSTKLKLTKG